jgi:hypothetical protein
MATLRTVIPDTIVFASLERVVTASMLVMIVAESMAETRPVKAARAMDAKEKNFMVLMREGIWGGWKSQARW